MNSQKPKLLLTLDDYKHHTFDKIRYGDTDRQGHVNNAMFIRFFETSRCEVIYLPGKELHDANASFVIANNNTDFINEIHWPGTVDIGLNVTKIGNSSFHTEQAIFQNGTLVSIATSVIVQVNNETKKSQPLSEKTKEILKTFQK